MKLIVLYGPEDSGKTTTLKIVYNKVKKLNSTETHWFKYYDDQRGQTDFRDVLILDEKLKQLSSNGIDVSNPYLSIQGGTLFDCDENNRLDQIVDMIDCISSTLLKDEDINKDLYKSLKKILSVCGSTKKCKDNIIEECQYLLNSIDCIEKEDQPNTLDDFCGEKVGFVLEGDYGFIHHDDKGTYKKYNLFTHLFNLISCDTIVCACAIIPNPNIQCQPFACLVLFVLFYLLHYRTIRVIMVNNGFPIPGKYDKTVWVKRDNRNQNIANIIYSYI